MPPRKIMIIRHGEKPPEGGGPPFGIDEDGERDDDGLTVTGWLRAGALIPFFAPRTGIFTDAAIARPDFIVAAQATPQRPSLRPKHTVKALADALGIERDLRFSPGQEDQAGSAILARDGVGLVSWEHHNIAILIGVLTGGTVEPPLWKGGRFDMVVVLDRAAGRWTLSQVPQLLLPGDRSTPLPRQ